MNSDILRAPLIKSAALLAVVSLLVYLTATSAEGSLWSSLGTLLVGTFRVVQLGLGLIVALFFCMAVLAGIFLGCVAMVSRDSAARMAEQLRRQVSDRLLLVRSLVLGVPSPGKRVAVVPDPRLKAELLETMAGALAAARDAQADAAEKIENVERRLNRIEQDRNLENLLEVQQGHVQNLAAQVMQVRDEMAALQGKVDELTRRLGDKQVESALIDLSGRMDLLEKNIFPLQEELSGIREALTGEGAAGKRAVRAGKESARPRLFTHLENEKMRTRVEKLVTETLDRNMSYDQVIDHLIAHAKGKAAEIIAAHPSLARDYIRYRRNNG